MEGVGRLPAAAALSACGRAFTAAGQAHSMDRPSHSPQADAVAYNGEVWTDARGYATVSLPPDAGLILPPFEYELRDLEPSSSARLSTALKDGRFTIATEQPHVKVAWRISGRRPAGHTRHRQQEEG
jgi:hypothetical protein